jgi:hypothetical protein
LDSHEGRWLVLHQNQIVKTVSEFEVIPRTLRTLLLGADTLGHVFGESWLWTPKRARGPPAAPDSVFLLLGDRATERIDTIARFRGEDQEGAAIVRMVRGYPLVVPNNPLASRDLGVVFPDGWVALVRHDPYRVDWRRPDSSWITGGPLPFKRIPVDRADQCAAMERLLEEERECDPRLLPGWPDVLPPFVREHVHTPVVFTVPDGRVVIQRTPSRDAPGTRYDVVDRNSRLDAVIRLDPGEQLVRIAPSFLFTLTTDEFDLQTLRRRPWSGG